MTSGTVPYDHDNFQEEQTRARCKATRTGDKLSHPLLNAVRFDFELDFDKVFGLNGMVIV